MSVCQENEARKLNKIQKLISFMYTSSPKSKNVLKF